VRRPWAWWLAWGIWVLTLALYGVALAIQRIVGHSAATQQEAGFARFSLVLAFVLFATVGAFVASRQPRNAVGWIFVAIGLLVGLSVAGGEYANYVFVEEPGSHPGGYLAGWFYLWTWSPVLGLIVTLPLLFPDGRVPGPRWRPVLWAVASTTIAITVAWMLRPGPMNDPKMESWGSNPIGIGALEGIYDGLEAFGTVMLVAVLATSATAMVVRFRRSRGDERQQLKWMTYGVVVMVATLFLGPFLPGDSSDLVFALTIAVLPVATAIAMLKYRLYDIDRVISRTLVYAVLTVILGAAYVGLVLAGQAVFSSFAGGSNLAIAASTLVVAALFLPVRARVQRVVDRRFYRHRYDAQRTLEAFGARLREQLELETLSADLRRAVEGTMQPAHMTLWLRGGARR
jgi:hypothetical protein